MDDQLRELLKTPHTAREIAAALGCSKPTAYARLREMRADLEEGVRETRSTGPRPKTYMLKASSP